MRHLFPGRGCCVICFPHNMMRVATLHRCIQPISLGRGGRFISSSTSTKLCTQLPNRGVLSVSGTDSQVFLNGVVAAGIKKHSFYTTFLSAQGRVLYDVFIYPYTTDGRPGYLIDYDNRPSDATPLLSLLKRHVLRSKVRLRDVSDEWNVWGVWDPASHRVAVPTTREWRPGRSGAMEPLYADDEHHLGAEYHPESIGTKDLRAPGMGDRLLVRAGDKPSISSSFEVAQSEAEYTLHRILHGVPEGQDDIVPQHAFPMDSNMDLMGGLDFRKGCYVGQELTVRTYHTGVLRKRVMPVSLAPAPYQKSPESPLEPDASVPSLPVHTAIQAERLASSLSDTSDRPTRPRGTGTLLSNMHGVGLALLRLEHVEGVERSDLVMNFTLMGDAGPSAWIVQPRRPAWWPLTTNDSQSD